MNADDVDHLYSRVFAFTFGEFTQTAPWNDRRVLSWATLIEILTTHKIGAKKGTCIVPATFRGTRRIKNDAEQIDVAMLDSDSGATMEEIAEAVRAHGWAAIISSTHSHLTQITEAKRTDWLQFCAKHSADAVTFLIKTKHMLPHIVAGAEVESEDAEYVRFCHAPCPKFRVALPLLRPWRASDYPTQDQANADWVIFIEALAAAMKLQHDQACTDTSHLFFLPRRPRNGPPPETCVIEGSAVESSPCRTQRRMTLCSPTVAATVRMVRPTQPHTNTLIPMARCTISSNGRASMASAS